MIAQIDLAVQSATRAFVNDVFSSPYWRGRESEAVSYFAFGFLQRECKAGDLLADATQIVVGGCVPGVAELNPKGRVNKDLVLWPKARMSCWDTDWNVCHIPIAVLEWKVFRAKRRRPQMSTYDLDWLERFSRGRREFVGYAVSLDLAGRDWRLRAARVYDAHTEREWLTL
jgi:hypothetical protein